MMMQCAYCDRSFERGAGLGNHIKSFHPGKPFAKRGDAVQSKKKQDGTEDKRFVENERQCPYCEEKVFGKPQKLAAHIRSAHPDKVKSKNQPNGHDHGVNFCPNCGTSIGAVSTAMRVAERLAR